LAVPGVVGFRAYQPVTGASQVVFTYEFADMAAWASWQSDEIIQKVMDELHNLPSTSMLKSGDRRRSFLNLSGLESISIDHILARFKYESLRVGVIGIEVQYTNPD
jgi:hypothetical protein